MAGTGHARAVQEARVRGNGAVQSYDLPRGSLPRGSRATAQSYPGDGGTSGRGRLLSAVRLCGPSRRRPAKMSQRGAEFWHGSEGAVPLIWRSQANCPPIGRSEKEMSTLLFTTSFTPLSLWDFSGTDLSCKVSAVTALGKHSGSCDPSCEKRFAQDILSLYDLSKDSRRSKH